MKELHTYKNKFLLCAAALSLLSSCVMENDACLPDTPSDGITLNVNISAGSILSRASGHEYPDDTDIDKGNRNDYYINADSDLSVYILKGGDPSAAGYGTILQKFEPQTVVRTIEGYRLSGPFTIPESGSEQIRDICIMVLANWNTGFKGNYIDTDAKTLLLSDLYGNSTDYGYNFTYPVASGSTTWHPKEPAAGASGQQPGGIPMFGLSKSIRVPESVGTLLPEIEVQNIPLIRALAKIEIVDAIEDQTITRVSMSSVAKYGRFIPFVDANTNADWTDPATLVSVPSLPQYYLSGAEAPDGGEKFLSNILFFGAEEVMDVEIDGEWMVNCKVMAAYVPEMALTDSDPSNPRPEFTVYIDNAEADHTVVLDNYSGGQPVQSGHLDAVLRNHIYRFILKGNSAKLTTDFQVLPWDMVWDDEPFIFENPRISAEGWLRWNTIDESVGPGSGEDGDPVHVSNGYIDFDYNYERGEYYSKELGSLKLKMKSGAYTDDEYAEGTFTLEAPMNAKWYASLVQIDDKRTPSFSFVDVENGKITNASRRMETIDGTQVEVVSDLEVKTEISGKIDGSPITLRIANCSQSVTDSDNEARLVIMVELPSGQRVEAAVIREPGDGRTNYIIFQERNDI